MNNPEVCMYIAIEEPKNTIQYGGVVAASIVKEIYEQILPYLEIKQDNLNALEKEFRYYIDEQYNTVKYYIGLMKEAIRKEYNYTLLFIGDGNSVIDQSPSAGSKVKQGGVVILYLG